MTKRHEPSTGCRRARVRFFRAPSGSPTIFALQGRQSEAEEIFERLLELRNDLGLIAEEWDPETRRQLGNFPQAFTHVALVNTAFNLSEHDGRSLDQRAPQEKPTEAY